MGVDDYEPRVLHQLLEFMHRYCTEVLEDGMVFCERAGRSREQLECEDVQLAVRWKAASSQTTAPHLTEYLAKARNREPLRVPEKPGLQLPMEAACLLRTNFQLDVEPCPVGDGAAPETTAPDDAHGPTQAKPHRSKHKNLEIKLLHKHPDALSSESYTHPAEFPTPDVPMADADIWE